MEIMEILTEPLTIGIIVVAVVVIGYFVWANKEGKWPFAE